MPIGTPAPSESTAGTIGGWSQEILIRVIEDILKNKYPTSMQSLSVGQLKVNHLLEIKDQLLVARDQHIHEIGKDGQPAFENSWVNYGTSSAPAGYWKDAFGVVHLQGLIKDGTVTTAAFTLPPGFRPDLQHVFSVISNAAVGRVDVMDDGTVVIANPSNNAWVTLDGIAFRAA